MSTSTHHAKAGPVARLTRRLRPVPGARADMPAANPQPPAPESPWVRAELDRIEAEATRRDLDAMSAPAPRPEVPDGPVHMVADGYGMMPCCGQHETAVPQSDYVTGDPRLVTCRTSAHDTMPDDRAANRHVSGRDAGRGHLRPAGPPQHHPGAGTVLAPRVPVRARERRGGRPVARQPVRGHGSRCVPLAGR